MNSIAMERTLEAIKYDNGKLQILDQLLLPFTTEYVPICDIKSAWKAINSMQVRGAPAIAVTACLSVAVQLRSNQFSSKTELDDFVRQQFDYLVTSRPTAVNLRQGAEAILTLSNRHKLDSSSLHEMKQRLVEELEGMLRKDVSDNRAIGEWGAAAVSVARDRVRVLTHCNTGALATAGYGTALGVVRSLHAAGRLEHVYFTETRPYMQGSRLTAYELQYEGIPATLVCDSAVAALLSTTNIDAVVVGADRVAANGDTANKIGTYQIALSAKHHGVPFFVAAPFTTIDFNTASGGEICVESRDQREMTHWKEVPIVPEGVSCWNPAFDVTPHALITGGIITEKGLFEPAQLASLSPPTS